MASSRTRDREEVLMSEKCQTLVAEGDAIQQDPVAQQHELLVSEIESTDGHLGTALRFVPKVEHESSFSCLGFV